MDIEELKHWLALLRVPGIGSRTYAKLLDTHTPRQLFAESFSGLAALGLKPEIASAVKTPDWQQVDLDLQWLQGANHHILTLYDQHYPPLLREIADPPPLLFIRGRPDILTRPQIAIVGSRNPSVVGFETAFEFAKSLCQYGFAITSGLALGIDAASHRGALQAKGYTIAVAGTGLDRVYPAKHKELALEIVDSGALVSEFPPGTVAKANHFPRRNRIISGLARGTLVVEAAKDSGSLITANLALEQNREVFAIPGSIHNPLARGCNALIRQGAKLVETAEDILEELNQYNHKHEEISLINLQSTLDLKQQTLLNLISYDPTSIDSLVENSQESTDSVSATLLILELQGYIQATPGGCYIRKK